MSEAVIVALIAAAVGLGTALPGIVKAIIDIRRQQDESQMSAVAILIDPLKRELAEERQERIEIQRILERERQELAETHQVLSDIQQQFSLWQNGVRRLVLQLQSHNIDPVWTPEEEQ